MFAEFVNEQMILFVALAVIVFMLVFSYFGDKLAGFKGVNPTEATRLFNDGAFVLDVRSANEYKEGFIGEAVNVAVGDLATQQSKLPKNKDAEIVVYCLSGGRSSRACGTLVKQGYTNIHNLTGGITAWKAANLPVNKPVSKKQRKKNA